MNVARRAINHNFANAIRNTVPFESIALDPTTMARPRELTVAEMKTVPTVVADDVVTNQVVRISLADRNTIPSVVLERGIFQQRISGAHAEINPIAPVAGGVRPSYRQSNRAAAWVEADARVVLGHAVLDENIPTLPDADAVAVVILGYRVLYNHVGSV